AAVFVRSLVVIESGARAMLLESHVGSNAREDQVNAVLELKVGDDAHVDHVKITGEGAGAMHVFTLMAAVGAHARFNEFLFTTGGSVVRNQAFVHFGGEGTIASIRGANLLKGRQHADTTLVVDHAVANCTSREVFKSVLDEEARNVFQGKITVRPHAQKTDAKMSTHALLLSDKAEADNKPELDRLSHAYTAEYANVHRGLHYLANAATEAYEDAREKVRGFLNAARKEEIIFTRNATEAINLVAYTFGRERIKPGDEIVLSIMEHHSNVVPWHFLRERQGAVIKWAPVDDEGNFLIDDFEKLL